MKLLFVFFSIIASTQSLMAKPSEVLCVSQNYKELFQEIHLTATSRGRYKTQLLVLDNSGDLQAKSLPESRLHVLRNELYNINSQEIVIEFEIVTPEDPVKPARIRLIKLGKNLKNWLCKGYF